MEREKVEDGGRAVGGELVVGSGGGAMSPIPDRQELMMARSLLPVLDTLDRLADEAEDEAGVRQVLEGYVMVDAVARERGLREQANRAEGGVTILRAKLGAMTKDGRKAGPGRGKQVPKKEPVLSGAEKKDRHQNKKLAQIDRKEPGKVKKTVEALLEQGERAPPAKVIKVVEAPPVKRGVVAASGEVEWYTPPEIIEAAREAMEGIDVDPASNEEAQAWIKARTFYTKKTDGLAHEWHGNAWINPPYAKGLVDRFAIKLLEEIDAGRVQEAIWLSNASYDTRWGQDLCERAISLCMVAGRLRFTPGSGQAAGAGAWASMILYFGMSAVRFRNAFEPHGVIWQKF